MARRRVIAVIGSSRPPPEAIEVAEELGRRIVEQGFRLVTGGLSGIMEAASRGAHQASSYREGDVVGILPGADAQTANPYVDIALPTNLGIARNVLVVSMADAVIAVGGSSGTLSELAIAWQSRSWRTQSCGRKLPVPPSFSSFVLATCSHRAPGGMAK